MEMTEQEVVKKYIQAQYKTRQVKILAELNGCSTATIEGILKKNGITFPPVKGPKTKEEQELYNKIMNEESISQMVIKKPVIVDTKPETTPTVNIKKNIPDAVRTLIENRIYEIDKCLDDLERQRNALNIEMQELTAFMAEC